MYIPKHFELDSKRARQLIESQLVGELVTCGPNGLDATFLPYSITWQDDQHATLKTHMSRVNPQWHHVGEALIIINGPNFYVPVSLHTPQNEGERSLLARPQMVPTWNYLSVHLHGQMICHEDEEWIRNSLRELVAQHETNWDVSSVSEEKLRKMMKAIVGIEIQVDRILAKAKMSQNLSSKGIEAMAEKLMRSGHDEQIVDFLRTVSLAHARAREQAVGAADSSQTRVRG